MSKKIKVSAPGKIHLSGEHSVVYGEPALIASVEKRIYIIGHKTEHKKILFYDKKNNKKKEWDYSEIKAFADQAKKDWQKFSLDKDITHLERVKKDFWGLRKVAIAQSYRFLNKEPSKGFCISVESDLNAGIGMGSSAAIGAALVAAVFRLEGEELDLEKINRIVYEIEKRVHGFPSGGDNTAIIYGGLLHFQKKDNQVMVKRLIVPKDLPELIVVNSGRPTESTGEMVGKVARGYKKEPAKFQKLFTSMGVVTEKMIQLCEQQYDGESDGESVVGCVGESVGKKLGLLVQENESYLEEIGVVGKRAQRIVRLIESMGGCAKICGAGGVEGGSGIILAFHLDLEFLKHFLTEQKITFFSVLRAKEGVRYEDI